MQFKTMALEKATGILAGVLALLFLALPLAVIAQEKTDDGFDVVYVTEEELAATREAASNASTIPAGLDSCFRYYDFGSVAVVPELPLASTLPGVPLGITLTIRNNNSHPITDGMVYVRIFKDRGSDKIQFGGDVVDQFVALRDITLSAGETKQGVFEWTVPTNAEAGEYQVATYFISAERFNLEGLSFTDDIIGGAVNFTVADGTDGTDGAVRFEREGVTVNGEVYEFATFMPVFDETTAEVKVNAIVSNTTNAPYKGTLTWTLYGWDGLRKETIQDTKRETVQIAANGTAQVTYTAPVGKGDQPVFYVVGELANGDSKSIINVRYVHVGYNTAWARFNDVGVDQYPLKEGSVAYACVQGFSGSSWEFPQGRLEVQVKAQGFFGDKVIGEGIYEGEMRQDFIALPVKITEAAEDFVVSAKLYVKDKLIDEVNIQYTCEVLTPGLCTQKQSGNTMYAIIVTISAILLGGAALMLYRHIKGGPSSGTTMPVTNNPA